MSTSNNNSVPNMNTNPKPNPKKKNKEAMYRKNLVLTILVMIANALIVYLLYATTRFATLGRTQFILANLLVFIVLMLLDYLTMIAIRNRKKSFYVSSIVLLSILLVIGSYGSYAIGRVNHTLDKMTQSSSGKKVQMAFVTYGDTTYDGLSDLNQKKVGIVADAQMSKAGQDKLMSEKIEPYYVEFEDYNSMMSALFNGDIQCVIVPSNYQNMFDAEEYMKPYLVKTHTLGEFETSVKEETYASSGKDLTKEPFTVLLIGTADGLSDTIILCSINPVSMKVTMSSIARDSYVPITCFKNNYNKINSARMVSRDCLIKTVEQLTGVKVDYYVDTNFKGVVEVVDALGGVRLNSPIAFVGQNSSSERGHFTIHVPQGENVLMDGEQALCFARERYKFATGDFARQQHQQEVIAAIIREIMATRDVNTFLNVFDAAGNNIETNMSIEQMAGFVSYAMSKSSRYYDSNQLDRVFTIVGSRITGYSSQAWNEHEKLMLYIYPLWQGAIDDTKKAIDDNLNLNRPIQPFAEIKWSAGETFEHPPICKEVYNEATKTNDANQVLVDYVGKQLSSLEEWAKNFDIQIEVEKVEGEDQKPGTILSQSVEAGTKASEIDSITVKVVSGNDDEEEESEEGESKVDFARCKSIGDVEALASKHGYTVEKMTSGDGIYETFKSVISVDHEAKKVVISVELSNSSLSSKEDSSLTPSDDPLHSLDH